MTKRTIVVLSLFVIMMSFTVVDFFTPDLPSVPFNYSNITFPSDVINNLSQMDNTPSNNTITDDGATLGRVLFYDVDLSKNHTTSCASCHIQKFSFTDTARFSRGFNGGLTPRNSMGLIHARFQRDSAFFWDNRAPSLEAQALMPIQNSVEMGLTLDTMIARISAKPFYAQLFQNAFGTTAVTSDKVAKALAQFVRSMNTFGSKFRQGVETSTGNPEIVPFPNFTDQENLGKNLFMDITRGNCQACHTRNVMVQQGAQNIGLDLIYADNGVGAASGRHAQDGKFSVPSLINVALTAPYMHDGRFKTLEEVIDFYSDSIKPHPNLSGFLREIIPGTVNPNNNTCDTCPPRHPHYTPTEKAALVAFLKTLTDTVITTDVRWSNPFTCGTHNSSQITTCDSYTWNGVNYTASGVYLKSYVNVGGCPSMDTLKLTINNGTHNVTRAVSCDAYTWNGTVYTSSGTFVRNYLNNNGCTSSDTLFLAINNSSHSLAVVTACDNYLWNGVNYNVSGTYLKNYVNTNGCSSVDSLLLTINRGTHISTIVNSCGPYTWNGVSYNSSGIYIRNYQNTSGCSSADTLHLTIKSPTASTSNLQICSSSLPYNWNGIICNAAGIYIKTLTNVAGCDSVATLNLSVSTSSPTTIPLVSQTLVDNTCGGRVYRYTVTTAITGASGYAWTIPLSVGGVSGIAVDSGDINNSRTIKLKYTSNLAAITGDSIKVRAFSGCGTTVAKGYKLINTLLTVPAAPSSIIITGVVTNVCGNRIYRYAAPLLPSATTSAVAATGYLWSMPTGTLGTTATIDSGSITSRVIRLKFTSNAAAINGDSIKVLFASSCGYSLPKAAKLTNTLLSVPAAPSSILMSLVSDACGARVYRYTAPALTAASLTTGAATGYVWSMPIGTVGSTGVIDSGSINSKVIRIRYTSNAAATTGDSIKVSFTSDCGNSLPKATKLTNLLKTGCPTLLSKSLLPEVPWTALSPKHLSVSVFPNPSSSAFHIVAKPAVVAGLPNETAIYVRIYDEMGRQRLVMNLVPDQKIQIGDDLPSGTYILEVAQGKETLRMKAIKL